MYDIPKHFGLRIVYFYWFTVVKVFLFQIFIFMLHFLGSIVEIAPCPTLVFGESQQSSKLASLGLRCR